MIHIIYIYLILVAFFMGVSYDDKDKWYEHFFSFIDVLIFPFAVIYIGLSRLYKNDYVFFIRILINKKIVKSNESLLYHIRMRRNLKNKIWNYLADKVVNKLAK